MLTLKSLTDWRDLPGMWRILSVQNKLRDSVHHAATFGWPLHDLRYYRWNLKPKKLYQDERSSWSLSGVQERIVKDLIERGISTVHVTDLLPEETFRELQQVAENLIQTPNNPYQNPIKQSHGRMPGAEKHYVVRLLGERPILSLKNPFLLFSVRDEILRIVSAYMGMFCRLLMLDVWCNIPTNGPDQFSQRWHRDPDDKKQIKTFLYLRDVDQRAGPFCYIPGTHNSGPFAKILPQTIDVSHYPADGTVDKLFPEDRRQVCVGRAGTLIFCDTTGFHKGGHSLSEPRLLVNCVYTTNAGAILNQKRFGKFYSVADSGTGSLGSLAGYAIHLHKS